MRFAATLVLATAASLLSVSAPARAEVVGRNDQAFVIRHTGEVQASAQEAWAEMIAPANWWSGEHTYSGDAANLALDANAGGCFCERLPASAERPSAGPRGSVEHMRVIFVEFPRALRMSGGLGPLQSEPVQAVLTVTFKPLDGGGTRVLWEYNVGGFMRFKTEQVAPLIDRVLGVQFTSLLGRLRPVAASEPATPTAPATTGPAFEPGGNSLNYSLPPGPAPVAPTEAPATSSVAEPAAPAPADEPAPRPEPAAAEPAAAEPPVTASEPAAAAPEPAIKPEPVATAPEPAPAPEPLARAASSPAEGQPPPPAPVNVEEAPKAPQAAPAAVDHPTVPEGVDLFHGTDPFGAH